MFGQIYVLFRKSHSRPWGDEVLVPVRNAQVVFRIKDIYLPWHLLSAALTLFLRMCTLLYDDLVKCCKQSRQNEDYEQDG